MKQVKIRVNFFYYYLPMILKEVSFNEESISNYYKNLIQAHIKYSQYFKINFIFYYSNLQLQTPHMHQTQFTIRESEQYITQHQKYNYILLSPSIGKIKNQRKQKVNKIRYQNIRQSNDNSINQLSNNYKYLTNQTKNSTKKQNISQFMSHNSPRLKQANFQEYLKMLSYKYNIKNRFTQSDDHNYDKNIIKLPGFITKRKNYHQTQQSLINQQKNYNSHQFYFSAGIKKRKYLNVTLYSQKKKNDQFVSGKKREIKIFSPKHSPNYQNDHNKYQKYICLCQKQLSQIYKLCLKCQRLLPGCNDHDKSQQVELKQMYKHFNQQVIKHISEKILKTKKQLALRVIKLKQNNQQLHKTNSLLISLIQSYIELNQQDHMTKVQLFHKIKHNVLNMWNQCIQFFHKLRYFQNKLTEVKKASTKFDINNFIW